MGGVVAVRSSTGASFVTESAPSSRSLAAQLRQFCRVWVNANLCRNSRHHATSGAGSLGVRLRQCLRPRWIHRPLHRPSACILRRAPRHLWRTTRPVPIHKNCKMSETHPAYWDLCPTIDHLVPIVSHQTATSCTAIKLNWVVVDKYDDMSNWEPPQPPGTSLPCRPGARIATQTPLERFAGRQEAASLRVTHRPST